MRISCTDIFAKVARAALRQIPLMNSSVEGEEIRVWEGYQPGDRGEPGEGAHPGAFDADPRALKRVERWKATIQAIPLRRLSTVDEQASVILFLASDDVSYVSGVTLDVNGGWLVS